jgi:hypothetical protein
MQESFDLRKILYLLGEEQGGFYLSADTVDLHLLVIESIHFSASTYCTDVKKKIRYHFYIRGSAPLSGHLHFPRILNDGPKTLLK